MTNLAKFLILLVIFVLLGGIGLTWSWMIIPIFKLCVAGAVITIVYLLIKEIRRFV